MKPALKLAIVATLILLIIVAEVAEARRGKGSRRRKMKKQNAKVVFHTNPKRAEYYLNADVSKALLESDQTKTLICARAHKSFDHRTLTTNSTSATR